MNALTTEIKTRARLLLKLLQNKNVAANKRALMLSRKQKWALPEEWQLRHCLNLAAADCGFQHWEHAREVLSGRALAGADMGDFWHGAEVGGYTNHWFSSYAQALTQLQAHPDDASWDIIGRNLIAGYRSNSWLTLAQYRLQATRVERFEKIWDVQQSKLDLQSTEDEAQRVLKSFVQQGRLIKIPEQRKKRLVILQWLVNQLETTRRYSEAEMNRFFLGFHEDYATLRREMIVNGLMIRQEGVYWRQPEDVDIAV